MVVEILYRKCAHMFNRYRTYVGVYCLLLSGYVSGSVVDLLTLEHHLHQLINQLPPPKARTKQRLILFNQATCAWNIEDFFQRFSFGKILKKRSHATGAFYAFGAAKAEIWQLDKEDIRSKDDHSVVIMHQGDYFYLDMLHKDHIEVFDKQLKARTVIDLFGSVDDYKKNQSLQQQRTIRLKGALRG